MVQPVVQGESDTDVEPALSAETLVRTQAMPETPGSTTFA